MQSYDIFNGLWPLFASFATFFILLIFLDVTLKAVALWKSARADQMGWFIALIVFNTMGILPIIYLLFFVRKPVAKTAPKSKKRLKS